MSTLGELVYKVRSKNAGPFWMTVDIFCGTPDAYEQVTRSVSTERIAQLVSVDPAHIKRFEIPDLNVVKLSMPRPQVQGSIEDRDMHGAALATLVQELSVN